MAGALEYRASALASQGQGRTICGYCAVFNSPTVIGDFEEVIAPSAFDRSLAEGADVLACYDHQRGQLLGRVSANTLRLSRDAHGLRFELDVPDTQLGRDVIELVRTKALQGCSFGFRVRPSGEKWEGKRRTLTDLDLHEISLVAEPAYPATSIAMRSKGRADKRSLYVWTF